jgi:hypothetical protein
VKSTIFFFLGLCGCLRAWAVHTLRQLSFTLCLAHRLDVICFAHDSSRLLCSVIGAGLGFGLGVKQRGRLCKAQHVQVMR